MDLTSAARDVVSRRITVALVVIVTNGLCYAIGVGAGRFNLDMQSFVIAHALIGAAVAVFLDWRSDDA